MKVPIGKTSKLSRGERRLVGTCLVAVAILAVVGYIGGFHNPPPDPPPIKRNLPVPNAYDSLQAACKL